MVEDAVRIRVSCRDCGFEKVVEKSDDAKPADVLIRHGQRTGHTLTVNRVEE